MKHLMVIFALLTGSAFGALPTGLVWEIRGGGTATNGGGFNPTNANMLTDAAATSATGNAPVITSASYNFVAGDVNSWVYIKSGTNWTAGWYKISSVATNAATVDATIGHAIQITNGKYANNTVAGVATTASPTGGTFSVDYSQQNSAKLSITDTASTGSSTTVTSVTGSFTPVMVGNLMHLTSTGTGAHGVVGWYEIVSYTNATTIVVDQTTNDGTALVAGNSSIGGAIATIGAIGSATTRLGAVAGNILWLNGTFSTGSDSPSCAGTATNPIQLIGYGTYRGDGYLGRTTTTGKLLVTTNMPSYVYTSTNRFNLSGVFWCVSNINFSVATGVSNPLVTLGADCAITQCVVTNPSTNTAAAGISLPSSRSIAENCDVLLTGVSGGATGYGISQGAVGTRAIGNYVQMSSSSSPGPAISLTAAGATTTEDNTVVGNGGPQGIYVNAVTAVPNVRHNTIVGFADGIGVVTGVTGLMYFSDNQITENTSNAIDYADAGEAAFTSYNRRRNVTTVTNGTNWTNATSFGSVVSSSGTSADDYVSYATQDLRLLSTSASTSAAQPASASIGSRQRPGGATQSSSGSSK